MHLREFSMRLPKEERAAFRRALAERAEVGRQTVWNWEHKLYRPSYQHLQAIAVATDGEVTAGDMYE